MFSHGSAHSRGVCILQNPCSTSVRLCSISTDAEGRLIIAKVIIENKPFFILNIYAPTDYRDQDKFIKTISEHLASKTENGETVTDEVQVKKEIEASYQSLYTSKFGDKSTQVSNYDNELEDFIEGLDIPQLSEGEQEPLETELTLEELKAALASFANNKSPGEDGFTKEFYEFFFYLLWKDLLNSYNEAFHKGELSIVNIPKKGSINPNTQRGY